VLQSCRPDILELPVPDAGRFCRISWWSAWQTCPSVGARQGGETIGDRNPSSLGPYAWMLCGCFATALMGQFAHLLKDECDWRVVALARSGLAFLFALGLARCAGARLVLWRPAALWLRGCASSVSLLCTFFALAHLPISEVLTLTNTFPIWVAFLSWPMLRTAPSPAVWLAAACGVCGVGLIEAPHYQVDGRLTTALALSLAAALTSAIAMLGLHRLKGIHPWSIVTHYSAVATVFVLAAWVVGGVPDLSPVAHMKTLLLLFATGVAATVGQVCVTKAFTAGAPARVSVVGLMQIVFALGLDTLFAGPHLQPITLAGIALVLAPTAWMMAGRRAPAQRGRSETDTSKRAVPLKGVPVGGE
jgi:drug/metabolite transporter (DMT)-like permease